MKAFKPIAGAVLLAASFQLQAQTLSVAGTADIDRYIWAVNAYLIAYIVAIPLAGKASDLIGRMPTFAGSLLVFLAGSIVCATGDTLAELVIGRAIQGFGGGGLLPVAHGLVHLPIWLPEPNEATPFDPGHSWLLGAVRRPARARPVSRSPPCS